MSDHPAISGIRAIWNGPFRGPLYMVASCAGFAVMLTLVRHLSSELHPFETAFFRNLFGLMFMVPWLLRVGWRGMKTRRLPMHLLRAVTGITAMLCLFTAVSRMPLAEATALTFTAPLFATIGAAVLLRERVRLRRWTATAIGFIGALIILRPGAEMISSAAWIALTSAAFMAGAVLCVKSLSRTEHPNAIVVYMGLLLTPLSLTPALAVWTTPSPMAWLWLVLVGLSATVGQVLLTRAFSVADATAVVPFDFSRLIFAATLAYVLFGEPVDLWTWVGGGVIVAATVYIAHREAQTGAASTASTRPEQP